MMKIATPSFMVAGALWVALAVVWLLGNRRLSCWPATWKEYFLPLAPVVMLGLAWIFSAMGVRLPFDTLFSVGIVMWACLTLVWLASILKRDSSIMDIAYALCAVIMLWAQWGLQGSDTSPRSLLMLVIVNLWGWRYTVYIAWRNLPHGEDRRYARWRERTGAPWWWWSYFQVFLLQAVMIWLWYAPIALAMSVPGPLGALEFIAALVWLVGFVFEAGADWQLARFKGDPTNRGTVLRSGLWGQSRHPNYFGEATMWVAYGLLALAHPCGWLGLLSTAFTVHMMYGGSATKMTDGYMRKKKPGYADYVASTPIFVPRIFGGRPQPPSTAPSNKDRQGDIR